MGYADDQERLAREAVEAARASLAESHAKRQARLVRQQADPRLARSEASIQMEFIEWVDRWAATPGREQLGLIYAIPNGEKREKRMRVRRDGSATWWSPDGVKLQRMGARSGVPDLHLPVPRGSLASLYIEVKRPGGKPSLEQRGWHARLLAAGNDVQVIDSADEMRDVVCQWLGLGDWRAWEE